MESFGHTETDCIVERVDYTETGYIVEKEVGYTETGCCTEEQSRRRAGRRDLDALKHICTADSC